jgi:putative flavoprotein involved in K+ transport
MPFPGEPRAFPTKDEMADYLEAYVARFQLPVALGTAVDGLRGQDGRYQVTAGDRRLEADQVVVATGAFQTPRVPSFADELDAAVRQLHSRAYRHPGQLLDGPVLVVGAGNSGAEIAVELAATHRTWLSGRSPGRLPVAHGGRLYWLLVGGQRSPYWWLMHERLTTDTRAGRKVREQALRRGAPLIRVGPKELRAAGVVQVPRTEGVRDGRPVLADGRVVEVANVVWCTGFAPDYTWIDLPVLGQDGYPRHHRGVVADAPGLYFVGLPFQYSLTSALIGGVDRDSAYVVGQIAARQRPAPVSGTA